MGTEMHIKPRVGLLGLGTMGFRMALNVARAGYPLAVYNRTRSKALALSDATGAVVCGSPAEVAEQSDVIITMVSDETASSELYFGPSGMVQKLRPGATCIEMSTVAPEFIRHLHQKLAPLGVQLLDAPVSGSVAHAEQGHLTIMVGSDQDIRPVLPVLQNIGARIIHVGPLGTGAAMKLAVNTIIFGLNQALAEALLMAESAGVDRSVAYDVFENSAAAAPYVHYRKQSFLKPDEVPVAFSMDLARKDLDLIQALARQFHVPIPQANLNRQIFCEAINQGRGREDVSAIAEHLRAIH
jgi:3-hydroxyisobutyrate dehydrogenase/2-hydroxy-3-oxopropionate reductase